MQSSYSDRTRRRSGRVSARFIWGRLRAPRSLAEQNERLVTTEELRRLRPTG